QALSLGPELFSLFGRGAANRFELGLVSLEKLTRPLVHSTRQQLGAFGAPLALFEELHERIEQKRLQDDDEHGERHHLNDEGEVEIEVYPSTSVTCQK